MQVCGCVWCLLRMEEKEGQACNDHTNSRGG